MEQITLNDTAIDTLGNCTIDSPLSIPKFISDSQRIAVDIEAEIIEKSLEKGKIPSFENAGPRKKIFFKPQNTRAAIVTCGGLCPGINNVIQGIVRILTFQYGVKTIFGVKYGFEGLVPRFGHSFIELTPQFVHDLHEKGGTVLGSSRGRQDEKEIVDTLVAHDINILFVIGGDGSLRGAYDIYREVKKRNLPIAIVGIPKTIDNDIWFVDKTFDFQPPFPLQHRQFMQRMLRL
jgi:6-phosphofructokinase 1